MIMNIHRVAIIGCGRMGQQYAEAYSTYPDTEVVAIAEHNPERRAAVGERFGVKALYPDYESLLRDDVPDLVAIITPSKYYRDAVIACAEAGVKGISTDKPIAAVLADADRMVEVCESRGIVYAGGNLQRAMSEVQEAGAMIRRGDFGEIIGAAVHRWALEISGGGCQQISVLRLLAGAEVEEVVAWGSPQEALDGDTDHDLAINGIFRMSGGIECPVYGMETPNRGVDVWSADSLVRWDWAPPEIYRGFDEAGNRVRVDHQYAPYQWSEFRYLTTSIRSFISAVETGSEMAISGHDLRQALEVAIAAKYSAKWGNVPVSLPLEDRSLALYPRAYRWVGGDESGRPQPAREARTGVIES
jgi:predicted dehydrogenase